MAGYYMRTQQFVLCVHIIVLSRFSSTVCNKHHVKDICMKTPGSHDCIYSQLF